MSDHNLTRTVTDTFTAPRWVHHLFKVLVGAVALVLIWGLLRSDIPIWLSACILSFGWVLTTKVAARLERGSNPFEVGPDIACDVALHLMPVALMLGYFWMWPVGLAIFGVLVLIYFFTYPEATP